MKILVTGANSILAQDVISTHIERGDKVYALIHRTPIANPHVIEIRMEELLNSNSSFNIVYHLAADTQTSSENCFELYQNNTELTKLLTTKISFRRFIYASTVSVYASSKEVIFEDSRIEPANPYAHSKYWGEWFVKQLPSYAILRFTSIFGEGMRKGSIIPAFINQAITNAEIGVFGNGSRLQNYIHHSTAAQFLLEAGKHAENFTGIAAGNKSISNLELAQHIALQTGARIVHRQEDNSSSFVYNNDFTISKLGHKKSDSTFESFLSDTIKWIKNTAY